MHTQMEMILFSLHIKTTETFVCFKLKITQKHSIAGLFPRYKHQLIQFRFSGLWVQSKHTWTKQLIAEQCGLRCFCVAAAHLDKGRARPGTTRWSWWERRSVDPSSKEPWPSEPPGSSGTASPLKTEQRTVSFPIGNFCFSNNFYIFFLQFYTKLAFICKYFCITFVLFLPS